MPEEEDYVSPSDVRLLLKEIIRLFGDQNRMRKVRSVLLRFLHEFAASERERGTRAHVRGNVRPTASRVQKVVTRRGA
jgi:hypothetical protein